MIKNLAIVRGGGDLATGTVHKLVKCGFDVLVLEMENPTVIRRTVAFAQAVYDGNVLVEDLQAVGVDEIDSIWKAFEKKTVPVLIDPGGKSIDILKPEIVVDAIIAKKNKGTYKNMASIVIGLGPGFSAGDDVHAVIETNRGHNLGRIIYEGSAEPDTGNPGKIEGYGRERIIRSPSAGKIGTMVKIGDIVKKGDLIAYTDETPVFSPIDGVVRGLIQPGIYVESQFKIGDVDPRSRKEYCFTVSDKARAIAGGVLEAILYLRRAIDK